MPKSELSAGLCLLAGLILLPAFGSNAASVRHYRFDIPSQELGDALTTCSLQADQQIVFSKDLVRGRTSPAVKGEFTADEALSKVLSGSALVVSRTTSGVLVLAQAAQSERPQGTSSAGVNTAASLKPATATTEAALEEIIVTAQRREENLQHAALAVTAVSGKTLDATSVQSLYDVSRIAPNIQFGGGYGGSALYIRGIGQQQAGLLSDPGAVIYIDGVYRPRVAGNSTNFSDVQQLEVLRGPQGSLFGKNAIGGALNIMTVAPNDELGGGGEVRAGSRNRINASGWINVPIVQDQLAARLSFEHDRQDGYMKNLYTGEKLTDTNYYTARGSVLWNLSDAFRLTLRGDYTKQDENGPGYKSLATPNPVYLTTGKYEARGDASNYNRATDTGVSATIDWDLGPGTLKSITAQRHWTQDYADDSDATPDPANRLQSPSSASENFLSQELQYNAKVFNDRLNFTFGAFYMDEHALQAVFPRLAFGPVQINLDNYRDQTTKSYALFGQGTLSLTDKFDLTLGLRYSKDDKDVSFLEYNYTLNAIDLDKSLSASYSAVTPKATLSYRFTSDLMVYATASRGFKGGGFNGQPTTPNEFTPFGPEYLWNYETGIKSEWLDRRLRANVVAYRMNYTDMQLSFVDATGISTVANAGAAQIDGLEAEVSALLTPSLLLSASYGLNDFKFTDINPGATGVTSSSLPPNSPRVTAAGGAEYTLKVSDKGRLVMRADYSWKSKTYFDASNTESTAQDPYGLWTGRLTYFSADDRWSIFAYGVNLANKYYHTVGLESLGQTYIRPGPPREVGVGFTADFGR